MNEPSADIGLPLSHIFVNITSTIQAIHCNRGIRLKLDFDLVKSVYVIFSSFLESYKYRTDATKIAEEQGCEKTRYITAEMCSMIGLTAIGIFWAFVSLISAVTASVGFFMPFWLRGFTENTAVHFGVFRRCNYPQLDNEGSLIIVEECGRYSTFSDIPSLSWQISTLTIGVGCGLAMLISLTAILAVCIREIITPVIARFAGVLQLCAGQLVVVVGISAFIQPDIRIIKSDINGLLMGAGIGIYPNGWDSEEVQQACGHSSRSYIIGECTLSWSFYLTTAGSAITLICSMLSCHASKRKHSHVNNM